MAANMTTTELQFYKDEYRATKKWKEKTLHRLWMSTFQEYRFNNFNELFGHLDKNIEMSPQALLATDGRVPTVNVLVRKFVALLTLRNPYFVVENLNPADEAIAYLLEKQYVNVLEETGFHGTGRRLLLWAALCGSCESKIGFGSEFVPLEEAWSGSMPSNAADKEFYEEATFGPTTEYTNRQLKPGYPIHLPIPPQDIFYDPGARTRRDVARIYHRTSRRVSDIYHDDRYIKASRAQVTGSRAHDSMSERTHPHYPPELEREARRSDVVECFDYATRRYFIFDLDVDKPLRDWSEYLIDIEDPYNQFCPIEDPDGPYGIPFAKLILHGARAADQIRSKVIDSVARDGKTTRLVDTQRFDEQKISEINSAKDGTTIAVDGLEDAIARGGSFFHEFKGTGAAPELLKLGAMIEQGTEMASGFTDQTRNQPSGETTATEVQARQNQQGISIEDIRDVYEQHLERVGKGTFRIMLQFWDEDKPMKIVGRDPRVVFWVKLERDRVRGNFTLRIHAGSTEKMDKATQRRQIIELTPRILELKRESDNDAARVAQGLPPSVVSADSLLRELLERFEPRLGDKILNDQEPVELLQRLIQQHGIMPESGSVSPELQRQIMQQIQGRAQSLGIGALPQGQQPGQPPASNVVSFEERQGVQAPAQPGVGGGVPQDSPAFDSGRTLSQTGAP